jgi:protein gp37
MSDKTKLTWTDATWNPVTGCDKVSQACKNCYAERDWERLSKKEDSVYFGRKFTDVQCHEERLDIPTRWTKPRKIFVNSMSDVFHPDIPLSFITQMYSQMAMNSHHIFQILTKRPHRMMAIYEDWAAKNDTYATLPNVWLGVSVEDQKSADERIPLLLVTNAAVKWLSIEPLLGPIDLVNDRDNFDKLPDYLKLVGMDCVPLDWIVVGGESGPNARPLSPDWVRTIRDDCKRLSIPFLFKQWGEWAPRENDSMVRVGKKNAGRLLDGVEYNEYPE